MAVWRRLESWLSWFPWYRREARDADLERELRDHLDLEAEEQRAAGLSPEHAAYAAHRALGNTLKIEEDVRAAWGFQWLETLLRDFRFAARGLKRDRRVAYLAISTLALGIGSTAVMFSLVYNLLFVPYSCYGDSGRLVVFNIHDLQQPGESGRESFLIPEFRAYHEQNRVFEDLVGSFNVDVLYRHGGGTRETLGTFVTPNTFEFFGVPPLLGRAPTTQDYKPGAPPVFAMNYTLWKSEFNGDRRIIGKSFVLNGRLRTLVAIMPPRFQAYGAGVWLPLTPGSEAVTSAAQGPVFLWAIGRLKPSVSLHAAAADLDVIARRLSSSYPALNPKKFVVTVQTLADAMMGNFRFMLYALLAGVGMLLFIACSNVAILLLSRATIRDREIAVRAAVGATRGRLIRQLLVEGLVLAGAACVLGCVLAYFGLKIIMATIPQRPLPGEAVVGLNSVVLLVALAVTALTALACGLAPALSAARGNLHDRLAGGGKGASGDFRHAGLRAVLVITEVALSTVLLAGAGLMTRSFLALTHGTLGFNPNRIAYMQLVMNRVNRKNTTQEEKIFFRQVLDRVEALPGVVAATVSLGVPPFMGGRSEIDVPGKVHSEQWVANLELCSTGYFQTLGLQLLQGRLLSASDVSSVQTVAVINQALVREYFGNENPIGQRIRFDVLDHFPDAPHDAYFTVIGVVSDFRNRGTAAPPQPGAFLPYTITAAGPGRTILVRSAVPPGSLLDRIRAQVWAVDANVAVRESGSLETFLEVYEYDVPRFDLIATGLFAGLGLMLVVVGIFSVMAYTVSLKTHEIGIRMALGAGKRDVVTMIIRQGLKLVLIGVPLGIAGALALTRFLASLLYGVKPNDPVTLAAVALLLTGVALLACFVAAQRATTIDPLVALRSE
jgi:putative ABC transport system permease protein